MNVHRQMFALVVIGAAAEILCTGSASGSGSSSSHHDFVSHVKHSLSIPAGHWAIAGVHANLKQHAINGLLVQVQPRHLEGFGGRADMMGRYRDDEYVKVEIFHHVDFCSQVEADQSILVDPLLHRPEPKAILHARKYRFINFLAPASLEASVSHWTDRAICAVVIPNETFYKWHHTLDVYLTLKFSVDEKATPPKGGAALLAAQNKAPTVIVQAMVDPKAARKGLYWHHTICNATTAYKASSSSSYQSASWRQMFAAVFLATGLGVVGAVSMLTLCLMKSGHRRGSYTVANTSDL